MDIMEEYLTDFVNKPAIIETLVDILICSVPLWLAAVIGLVIGWSWRPRWTGLLYLGLRPKLRLLWTFPPGFGPYRLWIALSAFTLATRLWSYFRVRHTTRSAEIRPVPAHYYDYILGNHYRMAPRAPSKENVVINENDLEHLLHLINGKGGEMTWQHLMERSTSNMTYQAWQHDPKMGPVIYKSKTFFEDATPELVRDFFWDDEFRPKWDPMLVRFKMVEESPFTGTTIVHWIKKFPFFCSDREYIIGRRIWEAGKTFYCVTKSVQYPALMRRDNPRRVDTYFSSWVIKPVQSRKSDGQTACVVILVHYEDMGIPKHVAKLGVHHGMWGTVKKLNGGFRAYQLARKSEAPVSRSTLVARNTTKICIEGNADLSQIVSGDKEACGAEDVQGREQGFIDWKWLVIAGTVALACGLHRGAIGKTLLVGAGQRIARVRAGN